jgi:hypothetical protein
VVALFALYVLVVPAKAQPDDRPPREEPAAPEKLVKPTKSATPKPAADEPKPSEPATPAAVPAEDIEPGAVPFPLPIISEILYAVPSGDAGDANRDGTRQVSGDEFIEIMNPHAKPIQLKGFVITDGSNPAKPQVKFVFPTCELPPKGVAVVFNGHQSTIAQPLGDERAAPTKPNPKFNNALVFTMRAKGSRNSLSNAGDMVILKGPDGRIVHRVRWGKAPDPKGSAMLDEAAPTTAKASVARSNHLRAGDWRVHTDDHAEAFSPGVGPVESKPAADPKPGEKP